jgi:hypothetical protein
VKVTTSLSGAGARPPAETVHVEEVVGEAVREPVAVRVPEGEVLRDALLLVPEGEPEVVKVGDRVLVRVREPVREGVVDREALREAVGEALRVGEAEGVGDALTLSKPTRRSTPHASGSCTFAVKKQVGFSKTPMLKTGPQVMYARPCLLGRYWPQGAPPSKNIAA